MIYDAKLRVLAIAKCGLTELMQMHVIGHDHVTDQLSQSL